MEVKSNLYECKHCAGIGTCTNGQDGNSCIACTKRNELPFWKINNKQKGLICACCGGIGLSETYTERLNKRTIPILAIYLPYALIVLILFSLLFRQQYFSELLAFSSAIIGTVVGYYFSNNKN